MQANSVLLPQTRSRTSSTWRGSCVVLTGLSIVVYLLFLDHVRGAVFRARANPREVPRVATLTPSDALMTVASGLRVHPSEGLPDTATGGVCDAPPGIRQDP